MTLPPQVLLARALVGFEGREGGLKFSQLLELLPNPLQVPEWQKIMPGRTLFGKQGIGVYRCKCFPIYLIMFVLKIAHQAAYSFISIPPLPWPRHLEDLRAGVSSRKSRRESSTCWRRSPECFCSFCLGCSISARGRSQSCGTLDDRRLFEPKPQNPTVNPKPRRSVKLTFRIFPKQTSPNTIEVLQGFGLKIYSAKGLRLAGVLQVVQHIGQLCLRLGEVVSPTKVL